MDSFSGQVLDWYDQHGRKDLPWQQDITPYRVWLSEVMLQQTQVKTVIPYFKTFTQHFAHVHALAEAPEDQVLKLWSGLGYYARARNLHKAAKQVCNDFAGEFPDTIEAMQLLAGVGRSTAAAILSLAYQQSHAILDGNVKRVLSRYHAIEGWTGKAAVSKQLWQVAEQHLPLSRHRDYTQAMMDLGATLCTRRNPRCQDCPLKTRCTAFKQGNMTDYPTPKKKQALPEKQTIMLILKDQQQAVFMEKRPPTGIWGSLWCFPQFDSQDELNQWLIQHGIKVAKTQQLGLLSHTFSHFRLHIEPLIMTLASPLKTSVMDDEMCLWYNIDTIFEGGLATPVQHLLNRLKQGNRHDSNG
ncbi:MAG: A/G-specific adenine glycosylase [Cocleimonas sp.]|nr:A/G-specific adenine glycosylase [Cocleimonas sp.]